IVARLVEARASDAEFAVLQRQVAADVRAGAHPAAAASARARGLIIARPPGTAPAVAIPGAEARP
ncbi:MAG TPA: hypothetical protein VGB15_17395, partial [Longimicrobium sp.]